MSGEMLYQAPRRHLCKPPEWAARGSVWRCGCGVYWRRDPAGPGTRTEWLIMGRLAVWRFRRQQRRRGMMAG